MIFSKFGVKVKALIMYPTKAKNYLQFFKDVGKSKGLLRSGWIREKIKNPESVAEHSFRVGVLSMILADALKANKEKLVKMALIHDLSMSITGDQVWVRWGIVNMKSREEKERKEIKGLVDMFSKIEERDEFIGIFEELLNRSSKESRIFWQIDKLEMAIQAFEYERDQNKNLEEFFQTADMYIKEPLIRNIFVEVLKSRSLKERSFAKW